MESGANLSQVSHLGSDEEERPRGNLSHVSHMRREPKALVRWETTHWSVLCCRICGLCTVPGNWYYALGAHRCRYCLNINITGTETDDCCLAKYNCIIAVAELRGSGSEVVHIHGTTSRTNSRSNVFFPAWSSEGSMSDITFLEDVIMAQSQSDEAAMSVTENVLSEIFDGVSSKQRARGMTIETPCDDAKTRDAVLLFPEEVKNERIKGFFVEKHLDIRKEEVISVKHVIQRILLAHQVCGTQVMTTNTSASEWERRLGNRDINIDSTNTVGLFRDSEAISDAAEGEIERGRVVRVCESDQFQCMVVVRGLPCRQVFKTRASLIQHQLHTPSHREFVENMRMRIMTPRAVRTYRPFTFGGYAEEPPVPPRNARSSGDP